jgi:hypothetical protein
MYILHEGFSPYIIYISGLVLYPLFSTTLFSYRKLANRQVVP